MSIVSRLLTFASGLLRRKSQSTRLAASVLALVASEASAQPQLGSTEPRAMVSIGHTRNILGMAASPDGKRLFTTDPQQICVWDVDTGKEIRVIGRRQGEHESVTSIGVGIAPSKDWILVTDDNGLTIYRASDLSPLKRVPARGHAFFLWNERSEKGYFGGKHPFELRPVEDEVFSLTQRFVRSEDTPPAGSALGVLDNVILLEGDRLFLDHRPGFAIVDANTWKSSLVSYEDRREFRPATSGLLLSTLARPLERGYVTDIELVRVPEMTVVAKRSFPGLAYAFGSDVRGREDGEYWIWANGKLLSVDANTLEDRHAFDLLGELGSRGEGVVRLIDLPKSKLHALSIGSKVWLLDLSTGRVVRSLGDNVFSAQRIAASPEGSEVLATDHNGTVKRIRFLPTGLVVKDTPVTARSLAYDPLGEEIAYAQGGAVVNVSTRAAFPATELVVGGKNFQAGATDMVFSADGNVISISDGVTITAISRQDGSTLISDALGGEYDRKGRMAISPDGKWLVAFGPLGRISGYDLHAKQKAWTAQIDSPRETFAFVGPETFACLRRDAIEYRSAETGDLLFENPIQTANWGLRFLGTVSPDQTRIAVYDGIELLVIETETGETLFRRPSPPLRDLVFFGGSAYVMGAADDNLLRLWSVASKSEVCSLATFVGNSEWVACSPDSRFDASERAIDKLYLVQGVAVRPLESMFERLYTPRLLNNLLQGKKLEPLPVDVGDLKPAPIVTISLADGTRNLHVEDDVSAVALRQSAVALKIKASAPGSALAELRYYQNGKLIGNAPAGGESLDTTFSATLEPGENVLRVVALNAQRTESRPADLALVYDAKAKPAAEDTPAGLQLHLVVVGVNQYQNPKYNLNYAEADAKAVREELEAKTAGIFSKVTVHHIVNEKAQKNTLVEALKSVSARAGKKDVFVFYFAGHGVMATEGKSEFFLVPHDVTQLYGADETLRSKGLSSAELLELSKLIPAQKQLFILDACQSAGALKDVALRGAAEEKAIAQLARSTGTHWLTASGSEQFATEFAQLGHGAFTYVLLDALKGKADTGDGRVTVNELKAYLESQVPEVTQKYKGTPQFPSSYGFGQDFPVAVVR